METTSSHKEAATMSRNHRGQAIISTPGHYHSDDMRWAIHHRGEQVWPFNGKPPSGNWTAWMSAVKRFSHKYHGNIITTTYDLDGNVIDTYLHSQDSRGVIKDGE
jgi:hypothetical protein